MNIYDKKQINCSICGKFIGEMDVDATIIFPLCKICKRKEKTILKKGIKKILVPIDQTKKSLKALDAAIYMAKHLGASITILRVIPIAYMTTSSFRNVIKEMMDESEKYIKDAREYCSKKNMVVMSKIVKGDEPEEIIKLAKKSNFNMIVMGSSGKGILKEMAFGSVSNYVLHSTNIPVLVVKEETAKLDTSISKQKTKLKKNATKPTIKIFKAKNKSSQKNLRHGDGVSFEKMKQRI